MYFTSQRGCNGICEIFRLSVFVWKKSIRVVPLSSIFFFQLPRKRLQRLWWNSHGSGLFYSRKLILAGFNFQNYRHYFQVFFFNENKQIIYFYVCMYKFLIFSFSLYVCKINFHTVFSAYRQGKEVLSYNKQKKRLDSKHRGYIAHCI